MSRPDGPTLGTTFLFLIIVVAGLLLRLRVLVSAESSLLTAVPDDAFYYLQVARNVVSGQGVTFDSLHVTNGFHPLWLVLLLPIAAVIDEPTLLLRVALGVGIVLNLMATAVTFAWLRRALSPGAALLAASLYFPNPAVAANSVNGLETALAGLLLVLAVRQTWLHHSAGRLALWLGLLVLARSDLALIALALAGVYLWQERPATRQAALRRLVGGPLLLVAPFYLWSWLAVGTPWPNSATAIPRITHANYLLAHSTPELIRFSAALFIRFVRAGLGPALGIPALFWLLLLAGTVMALSRPGSGRQWRPLLLGLATAVGALTLIHVGGRWLSRAWYFDSAIWTGGLLLGWIAWRVRRTALGRAGPALALLLLAGSIVGWRQPDRWLFAYPHQLEFRAGADWLNDNLAPGEWAGAFNAGMMGYYSDGRVVNLDGVINDAAYRAAVEQRLVPFMRAVPLTYLIDYQASATTFFPVFGPYEGAVLSEVERLDIPSVEWAEAPGQPIIIWQWSWNAAEVLWRQSR